jgi:hypothetical protein
MILILFSTTQFVRHYLLLNLFSGLFQTDHWLQRYGHSKLLGVFGVSNLSSRVVCIQLGNLGSLKIRAHLANLDQTISVIFVSMFSCVV